MKPGYDSRFQSQAWDEPPRPSSQSQSPWNFVIRPPSNYGNLGPQVNPNSVQPQGIPGGPQSGFYYGNYGQLANVQGLPQPQQTPFGYGMNPAPGRGGMGAPVNYQNVDAPIDAPIAAPAINRDPTAITEGWASLKNWVNSREGWEPGLRGLPSGVGVNQQPPPLPDMPPVQQGAYAAGINVGGPPVDELYSAMMTSPQAPGNQPSTAFNPVVSGMPTVAQETGTTAAPAAVANNSPYSGTPSSPVVSSPVVSDVLPSSTPAVSNAAAFSSYGSSGTPGFSNAIPDYVMPNETGVKGINYAIAGDGGANLLDTPVPAPQESWWSNATKDMSVGDWGNTALNVAKGAGALMQGWGAYKDGQRADKMFKEGQKQFAANYNNQVKTNNTYMEDRQRIRYGDSGGNAQSVSAYMDKNKLERYS